MTSRARPPLSLVMDLQTSSMSKVTKRMVSFCLWIDSVLHTNHLCFPGCPRDQTVFFWWRSGVREGNFEPHPTLISTVALSLSYCNGSVDVSVLYFAQLKVVDPTFLRDMII